MRARRLAAAVAAAALVLTGCTSGSDVVAIGGSFTFVSPGGEREFSYPEADRQPLGELAGPAVSGDRETISTADHLGEVVVLNVWGSWCAPCRLEAEDLRDAAASFDGEPVQFIGINVKDNVGAAADFEKTKDLNYPSIYDRNMRTLLSINGFPTGSVPSTIVLDKQGRVAQIWLRVITRTELEATVRALAVEDTASQATEDAAGGLAPDGPAGSVPDSSAPDASEPDTTPESTTPESESVVLESAG